MTNAIKQAIKRAPFYENIRAVYGRALKPIKARRLAALEIANWEASGRPVPPPPIVKHRLLLDCARRFKLRTLVETGTFRGDTVEATKRHFDNVYSIELSRELYNNARERFKADKNVKLIQGDSGKVLGTLVKQLYSPALFWLDGHYSEGITARGEKDTPVCDELDHILRSPQMGHVIIVDDARYFGMDPAYPSIEEVKEFIHERRKDVVVEVRDDSIRILPLKR